MYINVTSYRDIYSRKMCITLLDMLSKMIYKVDMFKGCQYVKMVAKEVQWWYWWWGYVLFIPHPNCGGIAASSFMMIYLLFLQHMYIFNSSMIFYLL